MLYFSSVWSVLELRMESYVCYKANMVVMQLCIVLWGEESTHVSLTERLRVHLCWRNALCLIVVSWVHCTRNPRDFVSVSLQSPVNRPGEWWVLPTPPGGAFVPSFGDNVRRCIAAADQLPLDLIHVIHERNFCMKETVSSATFHYRIKSLLYELSTLLLNIQQTYVGLSPLLNSLLEM